MWFLVKNILAQREVLLCAQMLYLMIDFNKELADDTTLILDGTKDSLVAVLNTLEIFGTLSG